MSGYSSNEKADEIESFFVKHPFPSATRKIAQSLETVRNNAKRLDRDAVPVSKFLETLTL